MAPHESPRMVVAGEALIDLIVEPDPRRPEARPGGSPANTAIALARLGTPVAFAGRFSHDRFGRLLRDNLEVNGVDLGYAVAAPEPASLAVVGLDERGSASYEFHVDQTADWAWQETELPATLPATVQGIHAGSLALALQPGARVLAEWLAQQRPRHLISLDPNIRPDLVGDREDYVPWLEQLVAASDLVKVSAEDLQWAYPGEDPVEVAMGWQREFGPQLVAVTLGGDGAVAVHSGRHLRRSSPTVSVVDTVGAGDAFSGGLLHWLASRDQLEREQLARLTDSAVAQCLDYANAAAAVACTRPGAQPPTAAEISELNQRRETEIST